MNSKERYLKYLESDHWKALRQKALSSSGHTCTACPSAFLVDVHHHTYRNLYDCTLRDVMPLCRKCHGAIHSGPAYDRISALPEYQRRAATISHLKKLQRHTYIESEQWQANEAIRKAAKLAHDMARAKRKKEEKLEKRAASIRLAQAIKSQKQIAHEQRVVEARARKKRLREERNAVSRNEFCVRDGMEDVAINLLCTLTRKVIRQMSLLTPT